MKRLLALLTTVPFVATSCVSFADSNEPSKPSNPDAEVPEVPEVPEIPQEPEPTPTPPDTSTPDNDAPVFGKDKLTFPLNTDLSNMDWITLLNITDTESPASDLVVTDYGNSSVVNISDTYQNQFSVKDPDGGESWKTVEITFQDMGLSDADIFDAANRMSFQIHTTHSGSEYYGSGYALSMDETTGDMYVMTNMHVVPVAASTTLLTHGYQKTGTYLPALCADYEFTTESRWDSARYTDLSILKVSGQSTDGTINGCSNPTPYTIDESLVEFPNLLELDAINDGGFYGYQTTTEFDNKDINVYLSAFPASGWDGNSYVGYGTVPTLINRKEELKNYTYYFSENKSYSSYQMASGISDGTRSYANSVIRVLGDNVTGGASGSIAIDKNLNLVGTVNAHNATNQLSVIITLGEINNFIDKYCQDPTHTNINMCK